MQLKVWSNRKRPVRLFETDLNTITTEFCTDARHRKCIAQNICRAEEPQFEVAKCETAGMSHNEWMTVDLYGSMDAKIAQRKKRDTRIAKALASRLRACKSYKLAWEPVGGVEKVVVSCFNERCKSRKKSRCTKKSGPCLDWQPKPVKRGGRA